jgi:hypothetical protein
VQYDYHFILNSDNTMKCLTWLLHSENAPREVHCCVIYFLCVSCKNLKFMEWWVFSTVITISANWKLWIGEKFSVMMHILWPCAVVCIEVKKQIDWYIWSNQKISIDENAFKLMLWSERICARIALRLSWRMFSLWNQETCEHLDQMQLSLSFFTFLSIIFIDHSNWVYI